MLGPKPFDAITYRKPKAAARKKEIERFVGVDTEAYSDGSLFMACTSEGDVFTPADMPDCFFDPKYDGASFLLFNMKYDSGAMLTCFLSHDQLKKLARYGVVYIKDGDETTTVQYIPHKYLLFRRGAMRREFWDISQYYPGSLDNSAKTYLNRRKIHVETKRFSRWYVRRNWKKLTRYCIRDALLTKELGDYFKMKLKEFGIKVTALYSSAAISFYFFHQRIPIVDIWSIWELYPEAVRYAHESYQGGKFECQARGSFTGYEYDIVSAYPFEMSQLLDISKCKVMHSTTYHEDIPYGFLRVHIHHIDFNVPPCHGLLLQGVRMYALGSYYATITKQEYEYLTGNGIDVDIVDGWWIEPKKHRHPYESTIDYLFRIKDEYKHKDRMIYQVVKICLNGYYGKLANVIGQYVPGEQRPDLPMDKHGDVELFKAGAAWNPFYASMITANTRIAISKVQQRLGDACIATHTDSVICTKPLPDEDLGNNLGDLKLDLTGSGLIIGCGLYDMGDKTAYRGFETHRGFSWETLLKEHPRAKSYQYSQTRVVSWRQACAWDKIESTNVFQKIPKKISLNSDVKRVWHRDVRGYHLLAGLEGSSPRMYNESSSPWKG